MPFTPIVMTITPNFETRELELLNKFIGVQTESGINQIALNTNETNLYGLIIGLEVVRQDETPVDSWIFTQNYGTIQPQNYVLVNPVTSNQSIEFCLYALDSSENPQIVWRSEIYQLYFNETIESGVTATNYPVYPQFINMINNLDNELIFEDFDPNKAYYLHNKVFFSGSTYQYINENPSLGNYPDYRASNQWWHLVAVSGSTIGIEVTSTITGNPGTDASVVNIGDSGYIQLQFTIPRGDKGDTGSNFILKGVVAELPISGVEGDAWALSGADPKTIYIWDTNTNSWSSIGPVTFSQNASDINVLDSADHFTSTNVEDVLAEIQTNVDLKINQTDASIENIANKIVIRDPDKTIKLTKLSFETNNIDNPYLNHYWDSNSGTFSTELLDGVVLQNGQEIHIYGKALEFIANGTVVQLAGSLDSYNTFMPAIPSQIQENPYLLLGIATSNIEQDSFGYVTWFGKVNDVYTTGFNNFDYLWYNHLTGGLTNVPPQAPAPKIRLGTVVKVATDGLENGIFLVRLSFYPYLNQINDVYINNPIDKDIIAFNQSSSRFENINQSEFTVGNSNNLNNQASVYYARQFDLLDLQISDLLSKAAIENFVPNGDFSKGTQGWSSPTAILSILDNTLIINSEGGGTFLSGPLTNEDAIPAHEIYVKLMVRSKSIDTSQIIVLLGSESELADTVKTIDSPVLNQWYLINEIISLSSFATGKIRPAIVFNDNSYFSVEFEVKYIFMTDLTKSIGGDFEVDVDQLYNWIKDYPNEWIDTSVYPTKYSAEDVLAKILTKDGHGSTIDSDTVDGYHATDFSFSGHTHTYVPPNSFNMGSSTFNSTTGVVINHTFGLPTNYFVSITPTSNGNGYIGEYYVQKDNNSMRVCNSGSSTTGTFDYIIKSL